MKWIEREGLGYGPGRLLSLTSSPFFAFCCLSLALYPLVLPIPPPSAHFTVMRIKSLDVCACQRFFILLVFVRFIRSDLFSVYIHPCLCAPGLQPYTDYSFVLVACTAVGCGASSPSTGRTLPASPAGTDTQTCSRNSL